MHVYKYVYARMYEWTQTYMYAYMHASTLCMYKRVCTRVCMYKVCALMDCVLISMDNLT